MPHLSRFIEAQESSYATALAEIKNGRKLTHWIWYIFPQLAGLGRSGTAVFYGIQNKNEAAEYFDHPLLRKRLIEISDALLHIENKTAHEIFGSPDDLKLRSCMTLFSLLENTDPVFQAVLDQYFNGEKDERTIDLLNQH
ncbi:MAG: hypothetical protein JWQ27_734 [Ferruginibacter sp.]|nr:hypothetical protein [Ferruginibacter sp.]